ncbi:MAG TPA: ATP-binding protein [Candidatus Omnitrophota bacterium]|nr:ATP-binding protein [Candidatus Omnitrophota bacterium]
MSEKLDFVKKLKSRLPQIEKESLYLKLLDTAQENLLLEDVCQALDEGVVLVDLKGIPFFSNRKANLVLGGIQTQSRQPLWNQVYDSTLAAFLKGHLLFVNSRTVNDFKILSPRALHLRVMIIPQENRGKKATLLLLVDITHRTEQEFEAAMLSRMESLIRLAGGIAHEIGNPLNAITIHLELLKKKLGDLPTLKRQELENSLNHIQDETRRLDRIIRNFLKATRKPPLRFHLDDLNEILTDAVSFLKPQLDAQKIKVKFSKDLALPVFLLDRERLYYAFMNLIKNAMEAMPEGGALKVSITHKPSCAIVTITDTGCGIDEKDIPMIFDIYYTTKAEGAGLGLMMVYDAITEHGGKIEVTSKKGKGTTFKVLLPIREPQLQLPHYKTSREG